MIVNKYNVANNICCNANPFTLIYLSIYFIYIYMNTYISVFFFQHLIEKFWYVITETCLAFTVFRDDFSARFVALFTFLLFMKAFHWLIEDRVDYVSTYDGN